jgi:ribonuclease HI
MQTIEIYTDGGCRGNPGVGAYAAIFKESGTGKVLYQLGDYNVHTTNQEMEVSAVLLATSIIVAMSRAGRRYIFKIYSDSEYCVNTFNNWLDGWVLSGKIKEKAHSRMWKDIDTFKRELKALGVAVSMEHVRGHADNKGNIEVDSLVNKLMDDGRVYNLILTNPDIRYLASNDIRSYSEPGANPAPIFVVVDCQNGKSVATYDGDELTNLLRSHLDTAPAALVAETRVIHEQE